jgi:RimJ/RimL family protein N-acetyltransferase
MGRRVTVGILGSIDSELHTERLRLRPPRAGDGPALHAAVVESLDALRAWPASLPWALQPPSVEASEAYCRQSAAAWTLRTALTYLAFDAEGHLVISCSLHSIQWELPKFELGFWCRSSRTRQGYAAEACGALVRYALEALGARRIEALADEANAGSRAVCEQVGMQLEGILRNERVTPDGQLRNTCVYARIR